MTIMILDANSEPNEPAKEECQYCPERWLIDSSDRYSLLLLWEEGCMLRRFHHQLQEYPSSASVLALVLTPYLALIEHDANRFLKEKMGVSLPPEDRRICEIRYASKSLSKTLSVENYFNEAKESIRAARREFWTSIPWFDSKRKPDIGISYFGDLPVFTTCTAARYVKKEMQSGKQSRGLAMKELGYNFGVSGSCLYGLASLLYPGEGCFCADEFVTRSNDRNISEIIKPLRRMNDSNEVDVPFFLLTELMCQIGASFALLDCGMITRRIFVKLLVAHLYHGYNSINTLLGYSHAYPGALVITPRLQRELGTVFDRSAKPVMKRMGKVRNALVHYDFSKFDFGKVPHNAHADCLFTEAVKQSTGLAGEEFESFLIETSLSVLQRATKLLEFPSYNAEFDPE